MKYDGENGGIIYVDVSEFTDKVREEANEKIADYLIKYPDANLADYYADNLTNTTLTDKVRKEGKELVKDDKGKWRHVVIKGDSLFLDGANYTDKVRQEERENIKEICNRCKTEKGLARAIGNYLKSNTIKTLTDNK